jgi:hypothetical protein
MSALLLHISNSRHLSSIAAEDVCPALRQGHDVWFPVLVECWALEKPNIFAGKCNIIQ